MGSFGTSQKISIRNLENNPGIIPLKLGTAKITKYTHTLIHYYDLNPIITEISRLQTQSANLKKLIIEDKYYSIDTSNYLKILNFAEEKVEDKLLEILPQQQRVKRGLINGLGSIFKSITGNLDANDGERYEKLIRELQENQVKLASNIKNQNSLSIDLINNFNKTIQQISHNEKLLEMKINQISDRILYKETTFFIKDIMNQIITMYEIINSILQDIENSISFLKLQIMHPSIIKTKDLFNELKKLRKEVKRNQLPLELTLDNILLYEKIIKIDGYILNNKITYILYIPITYPSEFNYYHLFSIPILTQGQFKAIIPRNKYLVKDGLYFAFLSDPCIEVPTQTFICGRLDLQEIKKETPCEIQLLDTNNSTCQQIKVKLSQSIIKRLDKSDQWIGVLPSEENIKLNCLHQEETRKFAAGTYLINIPVGCQISTRHETIDNTIQSISLNQPILFPDLNMDVTNTPKINFSLQLDNIELDGLQEIKTQIIQNQPDIFFEKVSHTPSVWTLIIYGLIILMLVYIVYKKVILKWYSPNPKEEHQPEEIDLSTVQLP